MDDENRIDVNGKVIRFRVAPYPARLTEGVYSKKIRDSFAKIGIEAPYLDIKCGGGKGTWSTDGWAEVIWQVNDVEHSYKCDKLGNAMNNLAAIAQMIEAECKAIRRGLKTFGQVMNQFRLGYDPTTGEKIFSPRQILGIPDEINDIDFVTYKYKKLVKEAHPDNGGDANKFKEINEAYTQLKKELEQDDI